jgi:phosphohistidine phosphatase
MGQTTLTKPNKLVYLVRHGEADSSVPDRPLTEQGRQSVRRVSAWAAAAGIHVQQIRHSGKLRAEQTAELLAEQLLPPGGVMLTKGLKPNDDVGFVADSIQTEEGPLMLVGHLPHLGRLVSQLVTGDAGRPVVEFGPSALVALVCRESGWVVVQAVQPEYVE